MTSAKNLKAASITELTTQELDESWHLLPIYVTRATPPRRFDEVTFHEPNYDMLSPTAKEEIQKFRNLMSRQSPEEIRELVDEATAVFIELGLEEKRVIH